jgi:hypothetical protein
VASTSELATAVMMAQSGEGMARAGGDGMARAGARRQGRKTPNLAGERVNGEATERAVAGGDRVDSLVTGAREGLTIGTRLPERGQLRGSEGGQADGWGRPVSGEGRSAMRERARGRWAAWAERGTGAWERGRKGWAGFGPAEGGIFPFSISISISFNLLFLLNKNLSIFS